MLYVDCDIEPLAVGNPRGIELVSLPRGMQILESAITSQERNIASQGATIPVQSSRIPSLKHPVRDLTLSWREIFLELRVSIIPSLPELLVLAWRLAKPSVAWVPGGCRESGLLRIYSSLLSYFYSGVSKRDGRCLDQGFLR